MAWPHPFRKDDENTRHAWGYTFQLTRSHFTPEQLYPLIYSYDSLVDECLNRLDEIFPAGNAELPRTNDSLSSKTEGSGIKKRDLYALLRDHASEDTKLGQLWQEVNTTPK